MVNEVESTINRPPTGANIKNANKIIFNVFSVLDFNNKKKVKLNKASEMKGGESV